MLVLYHGSNSICSQKVRLVLAEKGLAFDSRMIDLSGGAQFDPAYRALNPNSVVPTLVVARGPIIESNVINEYLDDAFPEPRLTPADPYDRARMRLWTKQLDEGIHVAANALSFGIAFRAAELKKSPAEQEARWRSIPDPARSARMKELIELGLDSPLVASALQRTRRMLADMDIALAQTSYLTGPTYSLADAAYTPYLVRLEQLSLDRLFTEHHPAVTRWYAAVTARASFKPAIGDYLDANRVAFARRAGAEAWPRLSAMIGA